MSEFENGAALLDDYGPALPDVGLPAQPAALEQPDKGKGPAKDKAKRAADGDNSKDKTWADRKARQKRNQSEGLDDAIDKALERSTKANEGKVAEKAQREKERAGRPGWSREYSEDSKILDDTLDRAFKSAGEKPKPVDAKTFGKPEHRAVRQELRHFFPGVKLADVAKKCVEIHQAFTQNPHAGREMLMNEFMRFSPESFGEFKGKQYSKDIDGTFERLADDRADMEDLQAFVDEHGEAAFEHLAGFLRHIKAGLQDPVGHSARIAMMYGGGITAQEMQQAQPSQAQQPAPQSVDAQTLEQNLGTLISQADHFGMPDLKDEQTLLAIADAFERGIVPLTGHHGNDLTNAYRYVQDRRTHERMQAQSSAAGRKSISGAPSFGGSYGNRQVPAKTLDSALDRAFARM